MLPAAFFVLSAPDSSALHPPRSSVKSPMYLKIIRSVEEHPLALQGWRILLLLECMVLDPTHQALPKPRATDLGVQMMPLPNDVAASAPPTLQWSSLVLPSPPHYLFLSVPLSLFESRDGKRRLSNGVK